VLLSLDTRRIQRPIGHQRIYDPTRDELFAAELGAGATGNGQPIRVKEMLAVLHEISDYSD